jgi:hypothetical protein
MYVDLLTFKLTFVLSIFKPYSMAQFKNVFLKLYINNLFLLFIHIIEGIIDED